jgi:hypothetical protein
LAAHSLVQVAEQTPLLQVWPAAHATAVLHFKHPPDIVQVCTPLPLHCLALAVVQVGVQAATQVPSLHFLPIDAQSVSLAQTDSLAQALLAHTFLMVSLCVQLPLQR